jgi:hypothetical protein
MKTKLGKVAVSSAAAAALMIPTAGLVSPAFANPTPPPGEDCSYPDTVATSTDLRLDYTVAPYGTQNVANVTVDSAVGTPEGEVAIRLIGQTRWVLTLQDGEATQALPRNLKARQTYEVRARYLGECDWRPSSDSAFYTVQKAAVQVTPSADAPRKGLFSATFAGSGGLNPQAGGARFIVKRVVNGKNPNIRAKATRVQDGYASVNMKGIKRKGTYNLIVRYQGNGNFQKGQGRTQFSIG